MLYTVLDMNAIVPHKDTLFFLAGMQRKIISILGKESQVYPQYPLFAFTEEAIPTGIISLIIECPTAENDFAVFPLKVESREGSLNLSIPFAKTSDGSDFAELDLSEEIKNAFPRKERIFRTATALMAENSWQLFDDKWNKIKK